jgi:hypothetical protein
VSTSEVDTWRTVNFWTEKLTGVLIWSFPKIDVSSVMRIETQGLKNKVVKTQGPKRYLTLFFIFLSILFLSWKVYNLSSGKKSKGKIKIFDNMKCFSNMWLRVLEICGRRQSRDVQPQPGFSVIQILITATTTSLPVAIFTNHWLSSYFKPVINWIINFYIRWIF